ncbi:24439_t:CDS:2 [Gigaspora margarita]|uniref:24439_t:CDS:1 n=1 Tax=Gigaspora margarita TaxID=4874 RepID=A0ABN7UM17_GIGMA|nr:24439_t:CDS:2 [Gigaspora margarita]
MFHDWCSTINEVDISNDGQINTLYENSQFEFDLGNQNENNFVGNLEAYQEEFQVAATFREWNYVDNRLDTLYNSNYAEHDISNNVLYQNAYNMDVRVRKVYR